MSFSISLSNLLGNWHLTRDIPGHASLEGTVAFTCEIEKGLFLYAERGLLHLADGQVFEATRRYLFQQRPVGFAVFFHETPRGLFHAVSLGDENGILMGETDHLCGDDLYRSRYEFHPDGTFRIRHAVEGPRKSYVSHSVYVRSRDA